MSAKYEDNNRQAIPRCIDYSAAASLGLLRTVRAQPKQPGDRTSATRDQWLNNPSLFAAIEFLGEAIIVKDFASQPAISAAEYILSTAPQSFKFIRELAGSFLADTAPIDIGQKPSTQETHYRRIARLKKTVRHYPYNPIAWSELSLSYATLGQIEKARPALEISLKLGGNNRFILRSAARSFLHMGERDRSVYILNRSGLCSTDPWITSAEIAICEGMGLKSRCVTKARLLLQDDNLTPFSRSELAVGIGTMEMKHGALRQAKRLIKQALNDPTENALAQAQWMTNQMGTDINDIPGIARLEHAVPGSYEAQASRFYHNADFSKSLMASESWAMFQQLSSRPIIHASHMAATFLEDDAKAISILTGATPAQKNDFLVKNNLAFCLIRSGKLDCGVNLLANLSGDSLSDRENFVLLATKGFARFRTGEYGEGRKLYMRAIDAFVLASDHPSAALAAYFLATEEKRLGSQFAESRVNEAKARIQKLKLAPLDFLAKKL